MPHKRTKLKWVSRPKRKKTCKELIYKGQHFCVFLGYLYPWRPNTGRGKPIGMWFETDKIQKFQSTKRTKTQFTDWEKCEVGNCHRLTVLVDGRNIYWAKHDPKKRKVFVFNTHLGRTPIGYLPETAVPLKLRRLMRKPRNGNGEPGIRTVNGSPAIDIK